MKIVNEAEADIRILLTVPASFLLVENFCVAGMATKNEDIVIFFCIKIGLHLTRLRIETGTVELFIKLVL
jgi:hypothetical protein